ncbi:MAG: hypothetical protein K1X53_08365 [Candidatus Sumerlaeaceae bacterium]|nr:hypothetical protein [Candidatus Sumerlaeaceae bacterium]
MDLRHNVSARWSRLKITKDDKTVYDSGDEGLNKYQSMPGFALDLAWSPDSAHLAYRQITSIRIINTDGKVTNQLPVSKDSAVSSFSWIDTTSVLVVSKKTENPLDMFGKPYQYSGYTDKAMDIRIQRLPLTGGGTELYQQVVRKPTFIFHSIGFLLDEISPKGDLVAFSDGANLCIFDTKVGKVSRKIAIPQKPPPKVEPMEEDWPEVRKAMEELAAEPQQLEGIWWQTHDRLVIGVGFLGSEVRSVYTYDIPSNTLTDKTSTLLPLWMGSIKARFYQDPNWFGASIK